MAQDLSKLTTEQLMEMLKGGRAPRPPDALDESFRQPELVSPMVRFGQGMSDIYGGAKQKYLNWTDPEAAQKYTQEGAENDAAVAKGRAAYGEGGFDPIRLGGSIATPLSALPMGAGGMLGRAGLGALTGALAGYSNFDQANTPTGNATNAAVGAAAGAVVNVAAPPIINGVIQGAQAVGSAAGQAWRTLVQKLSPDAAANISNKVQVTLQQSGLDFSKLSAATRASVLDEAANQFKVTGKLDPEMLLRRADIDAVGGVGSATRAQITRNPQDWTAAQNLQKTEVNIPAVARQEQETLTSRFQGQNTNTIKMAQTLADGMTADPLYAGGTRAGTQTQASDLVIKAIQARDRASQQAVDALYNKFREMGKGDVQVPDAHIADKLGTIVDEIGVENIPPAVLSRLKEFGFLDGVRKKLLTVTEADKLGRLIGNNNPGHGTASKVSVELKRAVDTAILDIPEIEASKALMTARNAARTRFAEQEAGKGVERAIADVAPDRFFSQNILNGNVRDIVAMREQLLKTYEGTQAWNSAREQVMQHIKNGATDGKGVFSGGQLEKELNKIGSDRLAEIFSKQEMAEINTLLRGSKAMTVEPAYSAPNRSNTTPSLIGQAMRLGNKTPVVNVLTHPISNQIEADMQQKALAQALSAGGHESVRAAEQGTARAEMVRLLTQGRAYNASAVPSAGHQQFKPSRK